MTRSRLAREWVEMSSAWIKESREGKNANRVALLDEPMLDLCGNVRGLRVVDCGCGEGRFTRMLAARGAAYALGLDLCEPMIKAAKELQSERDEYQVADVQDLSFLENESFDLAVSYLNQCDLPDFEANTREVFRILKEGGRFIITNLHPMRSAVGGWLKSHAGDKQHVILDRYFDEGERYWNMLRTDYTNFHRSLATYVGGFQRAGFELKRIIEPSISADKLELYPELADELRVPNFIVYELKRPVERN